MRIIKRILKGEPQETFNVRLPAVPMVARYDGDGRPCIWFMEDETQLVASPRTVVLQSTNAPFPSEAVQFLAYMGMIVRPGSVEGETKIPAQEYHVFVDMSSRTLISNDGSIHLP